MNFPLETELFQQVDKWLGGTQAHDPELSTDPDTQIELLRMWFPTWKMGYIYVLTAIPLQ